MYDLFMALSDPTRRQILLTLSNTRLSAGDIAARFRQQRPAISKHLTVLKQAGALVETRDRQKRLYAIAPHAFDPILSLLARIRPAAKTVSPTLATTPKPAVLPEVFRPARVAKKHDTFDLDFD